jgi:hypothetical protein
MNSTLRLELDGRQKAVLARTPVAAERVRYLADIPLAFAAACRARNPRAEVLTDPADLSPVEAVATDDLDRLLARPDAAAVLAAAEVLVAAISPASPGRLAELLASLGAQGFEILHLQPARAPNGYFDDRASELAGAWRDGALPADASIETLIVVARRGGGRRMMHLNLITYAPTLMDIRTRLPAEAMRSEPDLVVAHQKLPAALPSVTRDEPKVLVLQRPAPMDPAVWRQAMARHARNGWIVVLEYDDHPELVARVKARPVTEADWLRFAHVHAVQTSTPPLADLFGRYNPEVRLLPNAVFDLAPFPEALPRRVFYGAVSRGPFAATVAASLEPVVAEFPDTEFVVVGDRAVFDALPTVNKRFHGFMPYDEYLQLMATCAVSLSPIEGSEHQETKSDAKYLDGAARGVLTIASPAIYSGVMRHGKNGLIAQNVDDWAPLLAGALRDEAASRQMARNAWEYVAGARMFADQVRVRHDWYRDLWARRDELNAALAAR